MLSWKLVVLIITILIWYGACKILNDRRKYSGFMRIALKRLEAEEDKVNFLLSSLGGIHTDVLRLKNRGVSGTEIESIEKTLDKVNERFRKE